MTQAEHRPSGELQFIRKLTDRFPASGAVLTGIGDDGAVVDCRNDDASVVVTDMLLDGVHFETSCTPPELIGRKALAVNLSDLAAMACKPTAAFVSIALPRSIGAELQPDFPDRLYDGIAEIAEKHGATIAGGDTNSWAGPFAINVCLLGTPYGSRPVYRSGGNEGDILFVTGPLGGSLPSGRHLTFEPRLKIAQWLAENDLVTAMLDISDGLSVDLRRLADQSEVAAELNASQIPVHSDVPSSLSPSERLKAALCDGEDFELLIAVAPERVKSLRSQSLVSPSKLTQIGRLVRGSGCRLIFENGDSQELRPGGFVHQFTQT